MRLVTLIEFWSFTFNSSSLTCSIGQFNVCFMFENCNTKSLKLTKMPLHGEQRVWYSQNVGFYQKESLLLLDILVIVSLQMYF